MTLLLRRNGVSVVRSLTDNSYSEPRPLRERSVRLDASAPELRTTDAAIRANQAPGAVPILRHMCYTPSSFANVTMAMKSGGCSAMPLRRRTHMIWRQ